RFRVPLTPRPAYPGRQRVHRREPRLHRRDHRPGPALAVARTADAGRRRPPGRAVPRQPRDRRRAPPPGPRAGTLRAARQQEPDRTPLPQPGRAELDELLRPPDAAVVGALADAEAAARLLNGLALALPGLDRAEQPDDLLRRVRLVLRGRPFSA